MSSGELTEVKPSMSTSSLSPDHERDESFCVLIVDDEPNICAGLTKGLAAEADSIESTGDSEDALQKFANGVYHLVITDFRLRGNLNGIELIRQMLYMRPQTAIIVITAHGTVETAVEAMRAGAFDFISKPIDLNLIREQVRRAREHYLLRSENQRLKTRLADVGEVPGIVATSAVMEDVLRQVRQVAKTEATVFIQGESGTGKELIARALHDLSDRANGPFIAVNLGALPETLLESELFGHEKGAFTGANRRKQGCFEQAARGTLFLDEVTEMSPKSQVNLLRVLESKRLVRVGGEELISLNVRIISATNKSVEELIANGTFREDLYYRLNIVPIILPSLRQRREDIPLLVDHFVRHFCEKHNRPVKSVAAKAMQALRTAPWPGNVRQLRNMVERLVVTHVGQLVHYDELPAELTASDLPTDMKARSLNEAVEECEKATITAALAACDYHREKTAKCLGISLRTLHYKMVRYGLNS